MQVRWSVIGITLAAMAPLAAVSGSAAVEPETTIVVDAWILLGIWFLWQILVPVEGVANWAHAGGFVAGMALIGVFKDPHVRFFAPARHKGWHSSDW